jgi:hypothetical protein
MSEKREVNGESDSFAPRETRAVRLRLNCLKPNPDGVYQPPSYADYRSAVAFDGISIRPPKDLSTAYRKMNPGVRMSGQPNPRYSAKPVNFRMAYGARALWLRSLYSSPSQGKPGTWRSEAGVLRRAMMWRYA